jgi:hypothetical protein
MTTTTTTTICNNQPCGWKHFRLRGGRGDFVDGDDGHKDDNNNTDTKQPTLMPDAFLAERGGWSKTYN